MYKKTPLIALLFSFSTLLCKAQDSTSSVLATVYFMRASGTMGLSAFSAFIDDTLACHLHNNRFSVHMLPPGLHKFSTRADGKKPKKNVKTLDIPMAAGKKYYVMVDVVAGYLSGAMSVVEVTENTARKMFATLKEETDCGL